MANDWLEWETMPSMVYPRKYPACTLHGDKIYVMGGKGIRSMEVLDITTNTWTTGPALPNSSSYHAPQALSYNGSLYYIAPNGRVDVLGDTG